MKHDIETIKVKIIGKDKYNKPLSTENYDVRDTIKIIASMITIVESQCDVKSVITYHPENGSMVHVFATLAIVVSSVLNVIDSVSNSPMMNTINPKIAEQILFLQQEASKTDQDIFIQTSLDVNKVLRINKHTNFDIQNKNYFISDEFYFYGKLMSMGGVTSANIHIKTEDYGNVIVPMKESDILRYQKSGDLVVYQNICVQAIAIQNMLTGAINKVTSFKDIIRYNPNKNLLIAAQNKLGVAWQDIEDIDMWIQNIRGKI